MNIYKTDNDLRDAPEDLTPDAEGSRSLGIAFSWVIAIAYAVIAFFAGNYFGTASLAIGLMFIGAVQWIWLIPMMIGFRRSPRVVQGLAIGGGFIFLLNAACFGIFMTGM